MRLKSDAKNGYSAVRFKNLYGSVSRFVIVVLSTLSFMLFSNECGNTSDGAKRGRPTCKRAPSVVLNRDACSGLGGELLIAGDGPLISSNDGRYVAFLNFDNGELTPVFLKGVGIGISPCAFSPSRDRVYFESRFTPPAVGGERVLPTFFDRASLVGEYNIKTKVKRCLFLGPFIFGNFGYSPTDDTIIFDAIGWAEDGSRENPIRNHVYKLDAASGEVEEIIGSWGCIDVEAVAESGRIFLVSERKEALSAYRYFIYDYEGRRLEAVPVSYGDGALEGVYLSSDGKRVGFTRRSRITGIRYFSIERSVREGIEVIFVQGGEYRGWFRDGYCFSPDGRYLVALFAKRPWPCEYSEAILALFDLDTGEYDWLVKAEFAPVDLYLNWQQ